MNNIGHESGPRVTLDGMPVAERDLRTGNFEIKSGVMLSPAEILVFSSHKRYEDWMLSSPLAARYSEERRRREQALNIINKIGKERLTEHFNRLHKSLTVAGECMNNILEALPQEIQDTYGLHGLYKALLSPRVGTVEFYKDADYYSRMLFWEGIFQISSPYVGDENNDTLSSIRVLAPFTGITICQDSWWEGWWMDFWAVLQPIYVSDFANYPYFPNDAMSSYWFWSAGV